MFYAFLCVFSHIFQRVTSCIQMLCSELSLSHFHEANSAAYMANTIVTFISNLLFFS